MTEYTEERREHKFSRSHNEAIKSLTDGNIYWINRRLRGATGEGETDLCHFNVKYWVDRKGGERVDGWFETDSKQYHQIGVKCWMWHSIWHTPEKKLVDVTYNPHLETRNKGTFLTDDSRHTDFEKGIGYNNVIYIGSERAATLLQVESE